MIQSTYKILKEEVVGKSYNLELEGRVGYSIVRVYGFWEVVSGQEVATCSQ